MKKILDSILSIALTVAIILPGIPVQAAVPQIINFQGRLTNSSGVPITNASPGVNIVFKLYDQSNAGGNQLGSGWSETQTGVPVSNGIFSVQIGSNTALPLSVFGNTAVYVDISVGGETLYPRPRLLASPYALNSAGLEGNAASAFVQVSGSYSDPAWITGLAGSKISGNISGTSGGVTWGNVSGKPTTIAGYGITDSMSAAGTLTGLVQSVTSGNSYFTGGNVGIGTADPGTARLNVQKSGDGEWAGIIANTLGSGSPKGLLVLTGQNSSNVGLQVANGSLAAPTVVFTVTGAGDATASGVITASGGNSTQWNSKQAGDADLTDVADGTISGLNISNGLLYAPTSGNVGIGSAVPGAKLDVVGGSVRTDNQIVSTLATGTAPLAVNSTTKVASLNADLLDGMDSTAFGDATAANQTTILTRIGTNADAASIDSTLFGGQQYIWDNRASFGSSQKPATWTCRVVSASGNNQTVTASCAGSEKAISGGCDNVGGWPTNQGWSCYGANSVTVYVNCCQ